MHAAVHADDVDEDDQVHHADRDEEAARHDGADGAADAAQHPPVAYNPVDQPLDGQPDGAGDQKHHRRMTEREEEAHRHRAAPVLQQLARRVVDSREVVGVERVAQPERVGQPAQRQEGRMAEAVGEKQTPAGQVQQAHAAGQPGQPAPLSPVEGPGQRCPHQDPLSLPAIGTLSQVPIQFGVRGMGLTPIKGRASPPRRR